MNSKKMKMITLPLIALLSVAMIWEQSFIAAIFSAAAGILLLLTTAKFYKISRKKRMYKSYFYIYLYFSVVLTLLSMWILLEKFNLLADCREVVINVFLALFLYGAYVIAWNSGRIIGARKKLI